MILRLEVSSHYQSMYHLTHPKYLRRRRRRRRNRGRRSRGESRMRSVQRSSFLRGITDMEEAETL